MKRKLQQVKAQYTSRKFAMYCLWIWKLFYLIRAGKDSLEGDSKPSGKLDIHAFHNGGIQPAFSFFGL